MPFLKRFGVRAFDFWIWSEPEYESIEGFSFGFDTETSYRFGFEVESKRFGQVPEFLGPILSNRMAQLAAPKSPALKLIGKHLTKGPIVR